MSKATFYTGMTGKVMIDGEISYISNWSIDTSAEIIEISALGQRHKYKTAGQTDWSASADGTVYFGGAGSHKKLFEAMKDGKDVDCEFFLYCPATTGSSAPEAVKFSGKGYIESLSVDLSAEDKGNISISIAGCGELTLQGAQ